MRLAVAVLISVFIVSCEQKIPVSIDELIGKSAIESVHLPGTNDIDSTRIYFGANHVYTRTPGIYIQTKGHFEVRNDTLEVHYDCQKVCDNNYCGIQQYVMRSDGKLHLTFMRQRDGVIADLSTVSFGRVLELQN